MILDLIRRNLPIYLTMGIFDIFQAYHLYENIASYHNEMLK